MRRTAQETLEAMSRNRCKRRRANMRRAPLRPLARELARRVGCAPVLRGGRGRHAVRLARPHRGRALDQGGPVPDLRQFRLARLRRAQLALASGRRTSRRARSRRKRSAIPARASGRHSSPATNCSRSVPTAARSRPPPGRATTDATPAVPASTIAARRWRRSLLTRSSTSRASPWENSSIRWSRRTGPIRATKSG